MAKDKETGKIKDSTPCQFTVNQPTSTSAGSLCQDNMGSNYFCDVDGTVVLDDACELTELRIANVSPTAANIARTNDNILSVDGVDVPGDLITQINNNNVDWNYNFDGSGNHSPPGIPADADGHLFVARATFSSNPPGTCEQVPLTERVLYLPTPKAGPRQIESGSHDSANAKADCGCKSLSLAAARPDTYPIDIQDGWFRYLIFQPGGWQGNRLMVPGLQMDLHGHLQPTPLRARQIAVAATNVQWRPDSLRPILIQQPQGLPDFSGRDLGPLRFPSFPKFSSVICQFGDRTNTVLTSQCRQNAQQVLLHYGLDVLFQTNVGVNGFDERQGVIELWIKIVVPV